LRLRSDVPVGLLLSGGIDSSAIASSIHRETGGEGVAMLAAVSSDPRFDESPHVDVIAKHLRRDVYKVNIDLQADEAFDLLERVTWHNDEPVGSFTTVAHYKLMEAAKEHGITVVLSGQGADELLCGYKKYMAFYVQSLVKQGKVFTGAGMVLDSLRHGTVMRQFNMQEARRYLPGALTSRRPSVLGPALRDLPRVAVGLGKGMTVQERQALDLTSLSVPALTHYEDRMSMAHGREIRLPFLDVRLMDLLLGMPITLKMRSGWTKYLFRKAMEAELPKEITWRKDKQGFSLPQSVWLRGPLKKWILGLFSEDAMVFRHGLLDRGRFLDHYARFSAESEERGTVWYQEIFNAISMEIWLRQFERYVEPA
jgi:asparagine synthase (glutamine-hydrolysing)